MILLIWQFKLDSPWSFAQSNLVENVHPCRIGSIRGVEVIDRIINNEHREKNMDLLSDLCETMIDGSLCAMGGMTPFPVKSALQYFPEDFKPENK